MSERDDDPRQLFRIHAVAEQTGVPEATLRAWERRYQVPTPARTPSGYRVYSPGDVDMVRRMRELCERGISPGEAALMIAAEAPKARPGGEPEDLATQLASLGGALGYLERAALARLSSVSDRPLRCIGSSRATLEPYRGGPVRVTVELQHGDSQRMVVQAAVLHDADGAPIASAELTLVRVA